MQPFLTFKNPRERLVKIDHMISHYESITSQLCSNFNNAYFFVALIMFFTKISSKVLINPLIRFIFSHFVHKFHEIQNPRVLGPAVSEGAVYLVSTLHEQVELLCFQGNYCSSASYHSDNDDSIFDFSILSRITSESSLQSSNLTRSPTWSPMAEKENRGARAAKRSSSSFRTQGVFKTPSMKKFKPRNENTPQ